MVDTSELRPGTTTLACDRLVQAADRHHHTESFAMCANALIGILKHYRCKMPDSTAAHAAGRLQLNEHDCQSMLAQISDYTLQEPRLNGHVPKKLSLRPLRSGSWLCDPCGSVVWIAMLYVRCGLILWLLCSGTIYHQHSCKPWNGRLSSVTEK